MIVLLIIHELGGKKLNRPMFFLCMSVLLGKKKCEDASFVWLVLYSLIYINESCQTKNIYIDHQPGIN